MWCNAGPSCVPDSASRNRAVPSWLAVRSNLPSGLKARTTISPAFWRNSYEHRTPVRVPHPHGARVTTRHHPRAVGVEGDGGDRVSMAGAMLGIDLHVAVHVPQPRLTITAAQQQASTVAAEGGLVDRGIQGPAQGPWVSQGGHVPEPGRPGAAPRSRATSSRGCRQYPSMWGLIGRMPERPPCGCIPELDPATSPAPGRLGPHGRQRPTVWADRRGLDSARRPLVQAIV